VESVQVKGLGDPDACPVTQALAFVGSKWTPLVVVNLFAGSKRYGELQRALPRISPKTLADRLRALEDHGIVTRTVHPDTPPRVEYALTDRGRRLGEILNQVAEWADATPVPVRPTPSAAA
jgi:DNA-binding HxlR family transcriptional regulator